MTSDFFFPLSEVTKKIWLRNFWVAELLNYKYASFKKPRQQVFKGEFIPDKSLVVYKCHDHTLSIKENSSHFDRQQNEPNKKITGLDPLFYNE